MDRLPSEILCSILEYVENGKDIAKVELVCKRWLAASLNRKRLRTSGSINLLKRYSKLISCTGMLRLGLHDEQNRSLLASCLFPLQLSITVMDPRKESSELAIKQIVNQAFNGQQPIAIHLMCPSILPPRMPRKADPAEIVELGYIKIHRQMMLLDTLSNRLAYDIMETFSQATDGQGSVTLGHRSMIMPLKGIRLAKLILDYDSTNLTDVNDGLRKMIISAKIDEVVFQFKTIYKEHDLHGYLGKVSYVKVK